MSHMFISHFFHVQPIATEVAFNLILQSQSNWSLFSGTWQKRRKELFNRLSLEIGKMTLQMQWAVFISAFIFHSLFLACSHMRHAASLYLSLSCRMPLPLPLLSSNTSMPHSSPSPSPSPSPSFSPSPSPSSSPSPSPSPSLAIRHVSSPRTEEHWITDLRLSAFLI